jgi:hypothetical protein
LSRPVGSRNKRDAELLDRIAKRGDRLAVDILSEIANDPKEPKPLRIQAAIGVAPYQTHKLGLTPAPVPRIYLDPDAVQLPHPTCGEVADVVANIEYLTGLRASGRLDMDAADRLISDQRILGANLVEAAKLEAAQGGPRDQRIEIVGGLPQLPGTSIDFGGTEFAARVKAAQQAHPAVVNGEAVRPDQVAGPPVPFIPPEGSPLAEKPGQPKHPVGDPEPDDDPA